MIIMINKWQITRLGPLGSSKCARNLVKEHFLFSQKRCTCARPLPECTAEKAPLYG